MPVGSAPAGVLLKTLMAGAAVVCAGETTQIWLSPPSCKTQRFPSPSNAR